MRDPSPEVWDNLKLAFPELNDIQWAQFILWAELLREWNGKINLISRRDIEFLESRHLAHSLFFIRHSKIPTGARVLDVGTGGGLPGLPLAILFPDADFLLIDSVGKKLTAVRDLAEKLGLPNIETKQCRVEEIHRERFHFVLGRAVTSLDQFLPWVWPLISRKTANENGGEVFYWKGGNWKEELLKTQFPKPDYFPMKGLLNDEWFSERGLLRFQKQD